MGVSIQMRRCQLRQGFDGVGTCSDDGAVRYGPILPRLHGLWVGHEVAKGQRVPRNRLLMKPVKEHAPGARSSAVQAEGEFIQVGLQVVGANRPLRGAQQPPFYESGDSEHSWEHFVRIVAGTLDGGTLVGVIGPGCSWIGCQSVRMDRVEPGSK